MKAEVSNFGRRLESTGAREVALIIMGGVAVLVVGTFALAAPETISAYEAILITLITNAFLFLAGAFAMKKYGDVAELRADAEVEAEEVKKSPRLPADGEVGEAG